MYAPVKEECFKICFKSDLYLRAIYNGKCLLKMLHKFIYHKSFY